MKSTASATYSKRWKRRHYTIRQAGEGPYAADYILPDPGEAEDVELFAGFGVKDDVNALVTALRRLPLLDGYTVHGKQALSLEDRTTIESFTSRWGLLGLFHQRLLLQRYVPTPQGNVRALHAPPCGLPEVYEDLTSRGDLEPAIPASYLDATAHSRLAEGERASENRGEVWTRPLGDMAGPQIALCPLPAYYRPFMPQLGDAEEYPHFAQPEFWDHYAEDLGAFCVAVRDFQRVYQAVEASRTSGPARDHTYLLQRAFEPFLKTIHPVPVTDTTGEAWASWSFPSLLSVAYFQLYLRYAGGRVPRICEDEFCRAPFFPTHRLKRYCSSECEHRARSRRYDRLRSTKEKQQKRVQPDR